jgi:hypothetical protein
VDRHRFDADPDPYPTASYTQVGKSEFFKTFIYSSDSLHTCHNFQHLNSILKFFTKIIVEMDNGTDQGSGSAGLGCRLLSGSGKMIGTDPNGSGSSILVPF